MSHSDIEGMGHLAHSHFAARNKTPEPFWREVSNKITPLQVCLSFDPEFPCLEIYYNNAHLQQEKNVYEQDYSLLHYL